MSNYERSLGGSNVFDRKPTYKISQRSHYKMKKDIKLLELAKYYIDLAKECTAK
jgi:hypothetical protein